jgi:cobalt-zinc-cadmium efflux system outer membrane protein
VRLLAALAVAALPPVLSLREALRIFRERGFDLLLAQQQIQTAQGDFQISSAVPNPELNGSLGKAYDYDPSLCAGCSAVQVTAGLSDQGALFDLLANKRGLRRDVARAALDAAKLSRDDAQRTLTLQLKQQFLAAALSAEQARFAGEALQSNARTRELMERRFGAGAVSEADLARTQVVELESMQQLDVAKQQRAQATAAVAFLLGAEEPQPQLELDTSALQFRDAGAVDGLEALYRQALESRPDLRALEAQVQRAESAVSLARRQIFPEVELSANYTRQGTGNSAIQPPTLTFGAQFPLPLFYQQQGEISRAQSELRTQQILRSKARALVAEEVSQGWAAFQSGQKLVERMQGRILERSRTARDLVQVQYEKGAASLLELLDAQRTYNLVHAEYVLDLQLYWTALAQLEAAVGKELVQ